jgi:hypothetical protein
VVAAALMLAGCGSGGKGGGAAQGPSSSPTVTLPPAPSTPSAGAGNGADTGAPTGTPNGTPTGTGSATGADDGGASTDSTQTVEGVWLATVDGVKVQLVLAKGKAGLTSTHLCGGSYTDHDGVNLAMTCMDGDKERTSGHGAMAPDGKTLIVQWTDGVTDTFARTGLPSD